MDAISPDALADRIDRIESTTLLDTRNRSEIDEWRIDAPGLDRVVDGLGARPANDECIVAVNLGRQTTDDEEAFELEFGPNNCAVAAD